MASTRFKPSCSKGLVSLSVRFSTWVKAVTPVTSGLKVFSQTPSKDGGVETGESLCDKVVLAVSPDVVGGVIFEPLREEMKHIPTARVKTIGHPDEGAISATNHCEKDSNATDFLLSQSTGRHTLFTCGLQTVSMTVRKRPTFYPPVL